ncbi:hypothetical protein G6F57_017895 [Rhizopus arrhizus]|nr:hypothetical protein G6F57_017895 [Rhizopus arrhizus]
MDARYYDAAEVMGASGTRQFFDITLPNCKFGLLSAAFVVFVITITDFGNAAPGVWPDEFRDGLGGGHPAALAVVDFGADRTRGLAAPVRIGIAQRPAGGAPASAGARCGVRHWGAAGLRHDHPDGGDRGVRQLHAPVAVPHGMDAQALRHHRQRRLHTPVDFAVPVAGRGRRRRAAAVLPVFWRVPHRTGRGHARISAFRAACRGAGPGAGAVLHLRVQCARHALICAGS